MIGSYKSTLGSAVLAAVVGMSVAMDSEARKGPKGERGPGASERLTPLERLDGNDDLVVDFDEFTAGGRDASDIIEKLDSNDDDVLDFDEFSSRAGRRSELAEDYADELIACVEEMSGTEVDPRPTPEQAFDAIDTNDDDLINAAELEAVAFEKASDRFEAIDQNGDDVLDEEEFDLAAAAKRERRASFMACRDAVMIMDEEI